VSNFDLKIFKIFQKNPYKEFSTSEIVEILFPSIKIDKEEIKKKYPNIAEKKIKEQKALKEKYHRKILYHLKKLAENGFIAKTRTDNKGQKYFKATIKSVGMVYQNEEIILPIKRFEEENLILRAAPNQWINRIDALLINDEVTDVKKLAKIIKHLSPYVKDTIILIDRTISSLFNQKNIGATLKYLEHVAQDCGKTLCLNIDLHEFDNLELAPMHGINFIFSLKGRRIKKVEDKILSLLNSFAKTREFIYFQNKDISTAPYGVGKIGPYLIDEVEWRNFHKFTDAPVFVVSQLCVICDFLKLKETLKEKTQFDEFIYRLGKTFAIGNITQRKNMNMFFSKIASLFNIELQHAFALARNFLRLWNYGWKTELKKWKTRFFHS